MTLATTVLAMPATLARLDLGRVVRGVDALVRAHGGHGVPLSADVAIASLRGGACAAATTTLASERLERGVLSHVRVAPFFAGAFVVLRPKTTIDAPVLVAELRVVPTGFAAAYLDTCGPGITHKEFASRFAAPLAALVDESAGVRRRTIPTWIAPFSGGAGARLRARPLRGDALARILLAYVDRYLHALDAAPLARDEAANARASRALSDAFRAHTRIGARLTRHFGARFASSYLDLTWPQA